MKECDEAIQNLRLRERLRAIVQATVPAELKYAIALLLLASDQKADEVASGLEKANGDRELRRFVLWLPFILDNLWRPFPREDGLIPIALPPEGTSMEEKEQADKAFGWQPLFPSEDLTGSLAPSAPEIDNPSTLAAKTLVEATLLSRQPDESTEVERAEDTKGNRDRTDDKGLKFLPGAFVYRDHRQALSGNPLEVLQALYEAQGKTLTLAALRDKVWPDSIIGEETIRSAVKAARKALRQAIQAAGVEVPADPIPAVDRGTNRTAWCLDLP